MPLREARWCVVLSCTKVMALDLPPAGSWEGRQSLPPKPTSGVHGKSTEPLPWWARLIVGTALAASVALVGWLGQQTWSDMGRRVTYIEGEASRIGNDLSAIRSQMAEIRGLVQGFLSALPLKQRAAAYGIQQASIEEAPLAAGRTFSIEGRIGQTRYDLRLTITDVTKDIMRLRLDGAAGTNRFRNVSALIPLQPGSIVELPISLPGLPSLYVVILERRSDSVVVAVGAKGQKAT